MIGHELHRSGSFWSFLLSIDWQALAGVMFSIDTETGFDKVVLINAAWGLGENVVEGAVDPDEYEVFKPFLSKNR